MRLPMRLAIHWAPVFETGMSWISMPRYMVQTWFYDRGALM